MIDWYHKSNLMGVPRLFLGYQNEWDGSVHDAEFIDINHLSNTIKERHWGVEAEYTRGYRILHKIREILHQKNEERAGPYIRPEQKDAVIWRIELSSVEQPEPWLRIDDRFVDIFLRVYELLKPEQQLRADFGITTGEPRVGLVFKSLVKQLQLVRLKR